MLLSSFLASSDLKDHINGDFVVNNILPPPINGCISITTTITTTLVTTTAGRTYNIVPLGTFK